MVQTMVTEIAQGVKVTRILLIVVVTVFRAEHVKGFEYGRELESNTDLTCLIPTHLA